MTSVISSAVSGAGSMRDPILGTGIQHAMGRPGTRDAPPAISQPLTPMPDYMHPVTQSASKQWYKLHEEHMMSKLVDKRAGRKERNKSTRQEAVKIVRKIPVEILAKVWLQTEKQTAETRAFLVDKILPTLILGLEKLLVEVDRRELADTTGPDNNFNPINYLAQYLMRNNPRYSNFSEASPYIHGLRAMAEQLKEELYDLEENRYST